MIYKTQNTANFTIIDSEILRDESLSMGARMFYALAQSFSDCWNINIKHFAKILGVSEASVRKFRNELVSANILHFEQKRDEKGKLTQESVYTFKGFEVVEQNTESNTPIERSEAGWQSKELECYVAQDFTEGSNKPTPTSPIESSSYPFAQKTAYGYSSDISNINNLEKSTLSKSARDSENPQNSQTHKADLKSTESHALCHSAPTTMNDKPHVARSEQQGGEAAQDFTERSNTEAKLPHHKEEQQAAQYFGAKIGALQGEARELPKAVMTAAEPKQSPILDQKTSGITRLKLITRIKAFSDTHTKKQTLKAELNTQNFTQEEQQAFKDFIAYRKERGFLARSTRHSIIRDFEKLKSQNAPIMQCVELCINRGWSGLLKANEALQNYARYAQKPQARPQAQSALSKLTL